MRELRISNSAYKASMENVYWPARLQRLKNGPLVDLARELEVWLDGGHLVDAALRKLPSLLTKSFGEQYPTESITDNNSNI